MLLGAHHVSEQGLELIERWEGVVLHPYNDSSGYATVGIGHLLHRSPFVLQDTEHYARYTGLHGHQAPHPFDQADALALLAADVAWVERDILAYIHPRLTHPQFDALADLVFNCGPAPLSGTVGQLYNAKRFPEAATAMLSWCHSAGAIVPGLLARRRSEQQLILTGRY